jgi:hypothetical protein
MNEEMGKQKNKLRSEATSLFEVQRWMFDVQLVRVEQKYLKQIQYFT